MPRASHSPSEHATKTTCGMLVATLFANSAQKTEQKLAIRSMDKTHNTECVCFQRLPHHRNDFQLIAKEDKLTTIEIKFSIAWAILFFHLKDTFS